MRAILIPGNELFEILTGAKKETFRIWAPKEKKGRILLCGNMKKYKGYTCGYGLCTAQIGKVTCYPADAADGGDLYGWQLKQIRFIEPLQMKMRSRQSFFEVDDSLVREVKGLKMKEWFETFYDPLRSW